MKFILSAVVLAMCFCSFAQNSGIKLGDQAVFAACTNDEDPYFCTDETFKNIIISLITPEITEEIKNSPFKEGLDVSILFISDEEGKIIKEDIEILCKNSNLQASVRNLISRLPAFYPKSDKFQIRKSTHLYNLTLIPSAGYESYIIAPPSMTNNQIGYDSFATYEKCKGNIKESQICFYNAVLKTIYNKIHLPDSIVSYNGIINIYFLVNTDGSFILIDVIGGSVELAKEIEKLKNDVQKVFKKIPPATPALIKSIPTVQTFNFPIGVRMTVQNYYSN